ncbi:hypothetical protein HJC23_000984 [Cyclotella cryptica]|uniref:PSP1 C-terminal domain-containing protein n=1 Tax=Cyclotella cryptica TaxID=29204 RepID=A0ABD3QPQ2_9STRA
MALSDSKVQGISSSFSAMSFSSTISGEGIRKSDVTLSPVSSSPDGSFRNLIRQDSNHSSNFCPSSPISPVMRPQGGSQLVRHSSYSDDSQGLGSRGLSASPVINQSRFSPVGMHTFASLDSRTSRSFSGDSLLPAPPNLESNFDTTRPLDQDSPPSPFLHTTPTKHGISLNGGKMNRDRSYSSPVTNLRQLPIGAKSPLPSSNHVLFENKVSSSWNDGPGFPSPHVYRSDTLSTTTAPGERISCRPPRYGVNREVSPRAESRNLSSEGTFNFPSQTSYHNQISSASNPNHIRSQSLGVGIGGFQTFEGFQGGALNNRNNSLGGGTNAANSNAIQNQSELGGFPLFNLNQENSNFKQDNLHSRSPSLPPPGFISSQDFGHNFVAQQGPYYAQKPQVPILQRHHSTGAQHFLVNERGEIVGHVPVGSIGGYVQGVNCFNVTPSFHVLPQAPPFHDEGVQRHTMAKNAGSAVDRMQHQRHHTEPILFRLDHNSELNDDFDQALVGENIEGLEEADEATPDPATNPKPSSQLFTAGATLTKSRPKMVYNVKFKRSQRNFVLGDRITRDIKVGTYVKVEADRGEDLGIVFGVVPMDKFRPKHSSGEGDNSASSQTCHVGDLKKIMRVATNDEISLLEVKNEEEEELLKICRTKAHQRGLPMTVVDAEYQFDRHKLTFFFEAEGRIDFRELVRDLFSMYKTRIWMQQLDKSGAMKDD